MLWGRHRGGQTVVNRESRRASDTRDPRKGLLGRHSASAGGDVERMTMPISLAPPRSTAQRSTSGPCQACAHRTPASSRRVAAEFGQRSCAAARAGGARRAMASAVRAPSRARTASASRSGSPSASPSAASSEIAPGPLGVPPAAVGRLKGLGPESGLHPNGATAARATASAAARLDGDSIYALRAKNAGPCSSV